MGKLQSILCAQCGEACRSPESDEVIRIACNESCVQAWLDIWAPGLHTVPIEDVPVVTGRAKRYQ